MKYIFTTLVLFFSMATSAQRMTIDIIDFQDIIAPSDVDLNESIQSDDVIYREHAWRVPRDKGFYRIYDFDFDQMELNIYLTDYDYSVDTITASIFRILEMGDDGYPTQFTTLHEGTEFMYLLTETLLGESVFMMLYETDEHPWDAELEWSKEDYYAGFFTYHFILKLEQ